MQRQTSPVTGVTNYSYDEAGNLLTSTDAASPARTTTRTYDLANRVLTSTSTQTGFPTETVTWTYDDATAVNYGKGRVATMTDPSGSSTYAYERRGLLRSEGKTVETNPYSLVYGYDANGNRGSMTYPSGRTVTYAFDFADRPSAASSGLTTYVSTASYAPFGPETSIAFGNGTTKTASYDTRYRPSENKLVKDSPLTTLAQYTYMEDGVGNITQINDAVDANFNRGFSYDDLNRLKTANTTATPLWGSGTYNYDAMGNITSLALGTVRTANFAYVGTTPKLSSVTENSVNRPVTYDPTGNETQVGTGVFAYSSRNFLSSGDGLTYTYDGRGLRTMVVNSDVTPAKRYFFYSPEMNLLSESELTTVPAPTILYDYVWFNGHPVGQINGGTQWTFTDHLGTPLIQTDSLANVFWRAEHEPYGKVFALRGTPDQHQPLRLPGQEAEQLNLGENGASERFYNIFRWYRYGWGRYTQGDPIGLRASRDLFSYALQNPIGLVDPRGDITCKCSRYLRLVGPWHSTIIHHTYLRVGGKPRCQDNPSYGFFGEISPLASLPGTVKPNDPDTFGERCSIVPCEDDDRVIEFIQKHIAAPGPYICLGRNCWWFTDAALAYGRRSNCCPPDGGPPYPGEPAPPAWRTPPPSPGPTPPPSSPW